MALLATALLLLLSLVPPAFAASTLEPQVFRCDGDALTAQLIAGPMDDPMIPDPSSSPVPVGGSVVLQWRGLSLQLPRTNNAGPASFTDGKWWWSLEDPSHPSFRLRSGFGNPETIACEPPG